MASCRLSEPGFEPDGEGGTGVWLLSEGIAGQACEWLRITTGHESYKRGDGESNGLSHGDRRSRDFDGRAFDGLGFDGRSRAGDPCMLDDAKRGIDRRQNTESAEAGEDGVMRFDQRL